VAHADFLRREAHAKRTTAAGIRRIVPLLSVLQDRVWMERQADELEARAVELEAEADRQEVCRPPIGD
jgi:hypothetical protein